MTHITPKAVPVTPGVLSSGWTVELGIGDAEAVADVGIYDTSLYDSDAVYGSDDPFGYLLDVTGLVRQIKTKRGRQKFTARFLTGTAQIVLDDTDGFFTPPAGQAPLGVLPLRPGRAVRISYGNAVVFSGFIDSFDSNQAPSGDITSTVRCVDVFAQFLRNDLLAITDEGAGDTTPQRMRRLLDHFVGVGEYGFQFFGTPFATLQATAMGQNLLQELGITADSEGGGVYVSTLGDVHATSLSWFQDRTGEPITFTVGGTSPIKVVGSDSVWDIIRVINETH